MIQMNPTLQTYAERRDTFLKRVCADLQQDERFVAAWLAGSFGRGQADLVSDLDLHVVIADAYAPILLDRPRMVWSKSSPARMALFQRYGQPVIVHENHWNAICDGTFTYCEYADLVKVDWTLMAQSKAVRPHFTQVLFQRDMPVPHAPVPHAEGLAERKATIGEQVGYFWLMTATGCKYLVRGDMGAVIQQFSIVHHTLDEIERLLQGQPAIWGRRYLPAFEVPDVDAQAWVKRVRALCAQLLDRYPRIEALLGEPMNREAYAVVEALLKMAE